jgi:leucyl aminopeptidase
MLATRGLLHARTVISSEDIMAEISALTDRAAGKPAVIHPVAKSHYRAWLKGQNASLRNWIAATDFKAEPARHLLLPSRTGGIGSVLLILEDGLDLWSWGALPASIPEGRYRIDAPLTPVQASAAAFAWALGAYSFDRYRKPKREPAKLVWPKNADRAKVESMAAAVYWVRDMINTPADDMGPGELAAEAEKLAKAHGAKFNVIIGDALLKADYPSVHAVGRASARPPRLIDIKWGTKGPKIALVGKGVCFDSGGLDLKPAAGMLQMKKDMGGAAHVLGLARMIMETKLPVRLRVLAPAVENAVSGNAFHPLDILKTRKGISVEVGNTDAEGRLILSDALTEADRDDPALIIDFATLTGAARVALGPELPALFSNHDETAAKLLKLSNEHQEPFWRLPLHKPYRRMLDSKIADINNVGDGGFAGAITAALFLSEFVRPTTPWVHFDIMAANSRARPGRPEGADAMGLRAVYAHIANLATAGEGASEEAAAPAPAPAKRPARAKRRAPTRRPARR